MLALFKLWQVVLGLVLGLAVGWFVMAPVAREAGRAAGAEAGHAVGVAEERIAHEDSRRRAEAKADAYRRAAQDHIDDIEREFHTREAGRLIQLSALEDAIAQETDREQAAPQALPQAGGGVCAPAVPRRLRDALARVGADPARDDPAGPHAPMR